MNKDPLREALKEGHNILGLGASVALSAALLTPIPLLVALVAETAYLLFVPSSSWYVSRLSKREDAEIERQRQLLKMRILPTLSPNMRDRFSKIENKRRQIEADTQEDSTWFRELLRKLDYLLDKFLQFGVKEREFRTYLAEVLTECRSSNVGARVRKTSVVPNTGRPIQDGIAEIQAFYAQSHQELLQTLSLEADDSTKAILQKRIDVLQRRSEQVGKIGKMLTDLTYQMQLLEDTFGLISDEVRARTPEQVTSEIDEVVVQADVMTKSLEELLPYEQVSA